MLSKHGLHSDIVYAFVGICLHLLKIRKRTQWTRKTIDQRDILDIVTLKTQR